MRLLFEEFEAATRTVNQAFAKQARILKLVLYGSFARGDWVDDPVGGYHSDYDILVVVNDERLTDFDYWSTAEDRLMREVTIAKTLTAPVNFIVHSLTDVNNQLYKGRPFFIDIVREGVALYQAEGFPFSTPGRLPPEEALEEAEGHFAYWFAIAERSLRTFELQRMEGDDLGWRRKAVFELHQATEQLYHCTLLTFRLYSPKSHKLNFLRGLAEDIAPALIDAWPRADRFSRRCFELLRQAYVNARYSDHYAISGEELTWLGEHVVERQARVKQACEQHLAEVRTALPKAAK
nr:HEPN domain-containing protein [Sphingomonas sp. PR090111-T3T-6A]